MDLKAFFEFCNFEKIEYKEKECMSKHTSFKIGGPADGFVTVSSEKELVKVVRKLNELDIPFFILGKGSNLLVSDKGIDGVVISLAKINKIFVSGEQISAGAGVALSTVCTTAAANSLSGLEFTYGIPASVGGALYMNAGAYGGEMSDIVVKAEYISFNGEIGTISKDEMKFGYRTSAFMKRDKIITRVYYKLNNGVETEIRGKMEDFLNRRKTKQPLEYPSAGSTFKRPEGYFAGALIEENKLKGVSVGGAMVSEKHAGFVINCGKASCEDVKSLIMKIQETVLENNSVKLDPEVIFIGRE